MDVNLSKLVKNADYSGRIKYGYLDELIAEGDDEGSENEDHVMYTEKWYFSLCCENEFDAFRMYFKEIKRNRKLSDIIVEVNGQSVIKWNCALFNSVNTSFYESLEVNYIPPELSKVNQHEKILGASKSVSIGHSKAKGRYLYASQNIGINKIVIREKATILLNKPTCTFIGSPEISFYRCHHCAKAVNTFFICQNCKISVFCTKNCQTEAYNEYHRWECEGVKHHFWNSSEDYSHTALRMVLYGLSKEFDISPSENNSDSENYGNETNNYKAIFDLVYHFKVMSDRELDRALFHVTKTIVYLAERTNFFPHIQKQFQTTSMYNVLIRIGGLMLRHYLQAQVNNVIVDMPNPVTNSILSHIQYRTRGIYPTVALINHSCEPNVALIVANNYVIIKSIRAIKAGEEICLAYREIDPLLEMDDRQLICENLFYFKCRCPRCLFQETHFDNAYNCFKCKNGWGEDYLDEGVPKWFCTGCKYIETLDYYTHCMAEVKYCTNKYHETFNMEQLECAAKYCEMIYHRHSIKLYNVYTDLTLTYVATDANKSYPFHILNYGLRAINIMERAFAPGFFPLLLLQIEFFLHFLKSKDILEWFQGKLSKRDLANLDLVIRKIGNLRSNLKYYVPKSKIRMLTKMQKRLKSYMEFIE